MEDNYTLAKWLSGEMTQAELTEFENSADYHLYKKIASYSSELKTPSFEDKKMLTKVVAFPKKETKVIPLNYSWIFKIAASIVILLGLTFTYFNFATTTQESLNASKFSFQLPDQSQVVLNAASQIDYKKWNWDNHRELHLEGEAYFKVAKGKKFEVITNLGKVSVLGTQFNVKARDNRFDVTCYEGRVKVNYLAREVIITKGQRVSFSNGQSIEIPQNTATAPEWTTGELAFEKESLDHIVSELNRQYNITIVLKGNSNKLFSGLVPTNNIDTALQIISATYHLKQTRLETKIVLTTLNDQK
jgi:transmembrane sensor